MADFTLKELQEMLIELMMDSPYATGIDISKWREKFDIDTKDLKAILLILDFVVLRMGYGGYGSHKPTKDKKFDEYWQELLDHPEIIRMFYWYFQSETPWEEQLEFVCDILDEIGDDWEAFWLDLESINNNKSAGYALTAIRFLKRMKERYPNKVIGLYANRYFYKDWLKRYTDEVDDWPFYIAMYPYRNWLTDLTASFYGWWEGVYAKLTNSPIMPKGRDENDWEIWQVGDKTGLGKFLGTGTRDVDLNITRRIKTKFIEFLGKPKRWNSTPDVPDVPDTPEDCDEWQKRAEELLGHIKEFGVEFDVLEDILAELVGQAKRIEKVVEKEIE